MGSQIKVLMLTSKDGVIDEARGKMAGADKYLTKPFTRETILDAVLAHRPPKTAVSA
jgi:twitching motility two-component system response regulator PilG